MLPDRTDWDEQLDQFGLLAHEPHNLGNADNWVFVFRAGVRGLTSRCNGIVWHSELFHAWIPVAPLEGREHHIAAMLFCMDSAMECLVFALNALGQAVNKTLFRDVSSRSALRGISPRDVVGPKALAGYGRLFPTFQAKWAKESELVRLVAENHDVSKHRQSTFHGGTLRDDPPAEFIALDIPENVRDWFAPTSETLLPKDPKEPAQTRSVELHEWTTLEELEQRFLSFLSQSICAAVTDARRTIPLKNPVV
jgi:hypothetical protein